MTRLTLLAALIAGCAPHDTGGNATTRPTSERLHPEPQVRNVPDFRTLSIQGVRDWHVDISWNGSATFVFGAGGGPEDTLRVPDGTFDAQAIYAKLQPTLPDRDRTRPMAAVAIWRGDENSAICRYTYDFTQVRLVFLKALEFAENKQFRRRFEEKPPFLIGPDDWGQFKDGSASQRGEE